MRRMVVHASTKNYNRMVNSLILNAVKEPEDLEEYLCKGEEVTTYFPEDDELLSGFQKSRLTNLQTRGIIYLIESHIRPANTATALLGFDGYSLEHLMPKKWRNQWGSCDTPEMDKQRDIKLLTLGNLAIIPQSLNASIRDADWQTKLQGKDDDIIIVIYVPMARREQKPVFINDDLFGGTFRRNYEGDYHCTKLQVKSMLRDQTETTIDMEVLDDVPMSDLNYESIHGYRNRHRSLKPGHPFERMEDPDYRSIKRGTGKLPDQCGLLWGARGSNKKNQNHLVLENPGYVRTGKKQMRLGGVSDPRNKTLMKMFNLINIGERAGSGVPNIFNIWDDEGYEEPVIEEQFDPDRTIFSLAFIKKQSKKTIEENNRRKTIEEKQSKKTVEHMEKIRIYLAEHKEANTKEIAEHLGLSQVRTRVIMRSMDDIEGTGHTSNRRYHLKDSPET